MKAKTNWLPPLIGVIALVIIDQLTKYLAVTKLQPLPAVPLIRGVLELQYLENNGAAFGILQNARLFFIPVTVILVIALALFYRRIPADRRYLLMRFLVTLCVGGAIGNLIDRVRHGYVVDFIYFKLINFPIFNVADMCVTCAAILFIAAFLFKYNKPDDFAFLSKTEVKKDTEEKKEEAEEAKTKDASDSAEEEEPSDSAEEEAVEPADETNPDDMEDNIEPENTDEAQDDDH